MFFVCAYGNSLFLLLGFSTGVRLSGLWCVKGRSQVLLEAFYI